MARVFTKIGREISIAVKSGGGDPNNNPRLRAAVQNAKKANMPKVNVESAIKKASSKDAENYNEVVYEGYGPNGIAILVETTTDNPTRTVAKIREYFNKSGGSMGTSGSVDFMFTRKSMFQVKKSAMPDYEDMELDMIDFGLIEIKVTADEENPDNDMLVIYANFEDYGTMQKFLESKNIEIEEAGLIRTPNMTKELNDDQAEAIFKLLDKFEDDDDVANVFHMMDMSE